MRWLFWGFALALAAPVSAAGGMVFTDTINNVRPDHPSLAGTFWGWTFHSNLNSSQVTLPYVTRVNEVADTSTYLTLSTWDDSSAFNNPSLPGRGGYMVFDRHDTSIDFTLGSTIRAQILRMGCHASTATSPVPGMMIGLQDKRGRFFAIGLGWDFIDHYVRIINNPFTGAGTNWVKLTTSTNFYYLSGIRQGLTLELVVAGSRASLLVSGKELLDENQMPVRLDSGPPLNNLIFTDWQTYGGAIIGDYSLSSAGMVQFASLSYY